MIKEGLIERPGRAGEDRRENRELPAKLLARVADSGRGIQEFFLRPLSRIRGWRRIQRKREKLERPRALSRDSSRNCFDLNELQVEGGGLFLQPFHALQEGYP